MNHRQRELTPQLLSHRDKEPRVLEPYLLVCQITVLENNHVCWTVDTINLPGTPFSHSHNDCLYFCSDPECKFSGSKPKIAESSNS